MSEQKVKKLTIDCEALGWQAGDFENASVELLQYIMKSHLAISTILGSLEATGENHCDATIKWLGEAVRGAAMHFEDAKSCRDLTKTELAQLEQPDETAH